MRARNIKPSFFKNEILATSDPLYSLIFAGLWCLADREGRLEDRPRRIHLEINPGRTYDGTEMALAWLTEQGFLVRYSNSGKQYVQVVNFSKHQNPHMREPASIIPAPDSFFQLDDIGHISPRHQSSTVPAPGKHQAGPADSPSLIPDSPSLIPEEEKNSTTRKARVACRLPDDFGLTEERREIAKAENLDVERIFANFTDYWRAASGSRARKMDWDATWRVWCRNQDGRNSAARGAAQPRKTRYEEMQEALRNATETE